MDNSGSVQREVQRDGVLYLFAAANGLHLRTCSNDDVELLEKKIKKLLNINLIYISLNNPLSVKSLNAEVVEVASTLHSHKFKANTKGEAESALKFLELLSLLGFYKNQVFGLTEVGLKGEFKDQDPLIEKSLYYAEKIRGKLDSKKINRESLTQEIEELENKVNKIFSRRLESIDQIALKKYSKKALSILKSYIKS